MSYYFNLVITIIILIISTLFAFFISYISDLLERNIKKKYLYSTNVLLILLVMIVTTCSISFLNSWSFIDTIFISSLCFFGLGWITNITNKAAINSAGTVVKFITNNEYKHEYEGSSGSNNNVYFISSLIFLIISWSISFLMAYL